jgi:hypothetical protein
MVDPAHSRLPVASIVGFVGNYGSGKTEVAVNYALQVVETGRKLNIADLDIVNPYFRCREALEILEQHGIEVVVPRGANIHAELPILLPAVRGLLSRTGEVSVLDVGGDDVGARALSHLAPDFPAPGDYKLLQVINRQRPFTDSVEGCLRMRDQIEHSSRLRISGLVANNHLMDETTPEIIEEGYDFACAVAREAGVPIEMVVVAEDLVGEVNTRRIDEPLLLIDRRMTPPWVDDSASVGWAGERERLRLMRDS